MQNQTCTYEDEINLRDLFWYVLSYWRGICAGLLIGALLGGGFAVLKGQGTGSAEFEDTKEDSEAEKRLAYAEEIYGYAEEHLTNLLAYTEENRLLKLNAYDMYQGSIRYRVQAPIRNLTSLRWALTSYLEDGTLYRELEESCGFYTAGELGVLSEVRSDAETTVFLLQETEDEKWQLSGTLYIWGRTEAEANVLLTEAKECLQAYLSTIREDFALEAQTYEPAFVIQKANLNLADYQEQIQNDLQQGKKHLDTSKEELEEAKSAVQEAKSKTQDAEESGVGADTKTLAKYVLLGSLLGCIAAGGFTLMRFFFCGRLSTVSDPEGRLGVPVLGSIHNLTGYKGLDLWIARKRFGIYSTLSVEEQKQILLIRLKEQLEKQEDIHIVYLAGTLDTETEVLSMLREWLEAEGYEVSGPGNVLTCAENLQVARKSDAVLLVEDPASAWTTLVEEEARVLRKSVERVWMVLV